jgi:membrane-associated PAP2 superfamily phosphatase
MSLAELWWRYARWPLAVFVPLAIVCATTMVDAAIARAVFFDGHVFRGAGTWWATTVLHDGGRWVVRFLVAGALGLIVATYVRRDLIAWRRPSAYFAIAAILTVGVVGLLKTITNVDCPWDLEMFGGRFPYVHLFADRPNDLRGAHCFPAAHASSGYALMALYFAFRERDTRRARLGLALGFGLGVSFGIAQEARGAHFFSHDLWSATLAWLIALTTYVVGFRGALWDRNATKA